MPSEQRETMQRVKTQPAYEHVCARIRRAIHLGEYLPGDRLPSERDMAGQLGVSRVTIREALRVLEGESYIVTTGRAGGGRVEVARTKVAVEASFDGADRSAGYWRQYLRDHLGQIDNLFDFRHANEAYAAGLAAHWCTDEQLDRLRQSIEDMRRSTEMATFRRADSTFHLTIAGASANSYFQKAIEDARADMFRPMDALNVDVTSSKSIKHHSEVLKAIESRDEGKARNAMARHIKFSRDEIRRVILDDGG
jgi:GntR family transcriptional repressor for pyruvate dehydrogenase complex